MAEAKKASAKGAVKRAAARKPTVMAKADRKEDAKQVSLPIVAPSVLVAPTAQVAEVVKLSPAQERGEVLRQAVSEAVTVTAKGALEVNGKIIEALTAQSDAILELWRSALAAPHLSEAIRVQTSGTRQAYENASAQLRDIAETTAHWYNKSIEPLQSVLQRQGR
jgi:hypothetical protein